MDFIYRNSLLYIIHYIKSFNFTPKYIFGHPDILKSHDHYSDNFPYKLPARTQGTEC